MTRHINEEKKEQQTMLLSLLLVVAIFFIINNTFIAQKSKDSQKSSPVSILSEEKQDIKVNDASLSPSQVDNHLLFKNNKMMGSFSSNGNFLSSELFDYKQTTAQNSPYVQLLSPKNYWSTLSWSTPNGFNSNQEVWQNNTQNLTPSTPIKLIFKNDNFLIERTISIDDAYMITFTDQVKNLSEKTHVLKLSGNIFQKLENKSQISSVHQGLVGFLNGKLVEEDYSSVAKEQYHYSTHNGWLGITDKYWQTIYILDDYKKPVSVSFSSQDQLFKASFETEYYQLLPQETLTKTTRLFSGAKTLSVITNYQNKLNIPRFDLSIDFGWFYFLTKPFLYFLRFLYSLVGNMGIAILLFATLLRIVMLPIATKSYINMARMKKIQPKLKVIQERYKDNRMILQQEMLKLYKKEKINPAGGCLPLLIQIPIFFALYKVLSVSILMRQAPFFGWIHDLSAPDPSSVFTLFGLVPWPIPSFLNLGIWPILMGITMWIQQKLNPAPQDKAQENIFKFMPVIFTFMMGNLASGLIIYWTWSNILSIFQQKYILKKVGVHE